MKMVKTTIENEREADKIQKNRGDETQRYTRRFTPARQLANSSSYEYSDVAVSKIFVTIEKELKRVKASFNKASQGVDLRLI